MYNLPMVIRSCSPVPSSYQQERRKKIALESSLLNFAADKKQMEQEINRLRAEAQQSKDFRERLRKREEQIGFYEESLQVVRADLENLNNVIFDKNKQYILVTDELDCIKGANAELLQDKAQLTNTLELITQQISKLVAAMNCECELQGDIVSQFGADCKAIGKQFDNMQRDIYELLKINDQARLQNSASILAQKEKVVRLQYQKRLIEERFHDEKRRKQHAYTEDKDAKVHALQVQLLKQQQESQRKMFHMSQMKASQSSRISDLSVEKENSLMQQVQTYYRRVKDLEKEKRELKQELDKIKSAYKSVIDKYSKLSFNAQKQGSNDHLVHMKTIRKLEEERKILEIRLEQLVFRNKSLEGELSIYKTES